jgi:hypothetical protein
MKDSEPHVKKIFRLGFACQRAASPFGVMRKHGSDIRGDEPETQAHQVLGPLLS